MQMVHVRERKKSVERRVDGSGHAVFSEGRERIEADHFVFVSFAAVEILELLEPVLIEQRKSGFFDGAEVAAAAFYGENACGLAGERIGQIHFRAGIAAAEIGDAQVGSEKVGAIAKKSEGIARKFFGSAGIPQIRQMR